MSVSARLQLFWARLLLHAMGLPTVERKKRAADALDGVMKSCRAE